MGIFEKKKIGGMEVGMASMQLSFLMALAKKMNVTPKELADACAEEDPMFLATFTAEFARAMTEKQVARIQKQNKDNE